MICDNQYIQIEMLMLSQVIRPLVTMLNEQHIYTKLLNVGGWVFSSLTSTDKTVTNFNMNIHCSESIIPDYFFLTPLMAIYLHVQL